MLMKCYEPCLILLYLDVIKNNAIKLIIISIVLYKSSNISLVHVLTAQYLPTHCVKPVIE